MMSSSQCERGAAQSAMSPAHNYTLMLAVLFISFIPITTSAPVLLNPSSIDHEQLLTQITDLCSFYLSADPSFRTSDILEDLCFLMLGSLQKSKEITARETSKRFLFHYTKPNGAGLSDGTDDLQGPGRIQSRGHFLYRPRNGRRSAEYV
ncbi:neuromedin-U isoform X3 [Ctenopharyngodon idella]|uniref:neuromedin-U isoform X3 n=1 Tax=Ctenopharyngodon idella TaxID=7959 RepID=UPI00222F2F72|nr:neuromedin-U isoform X3 [Ctenopharyngodon idella]XP_051732387.1 neuromedin-U isoform X3 [Ctenopharyngodon idella]